MIPLSKKKLILDKLSAINNNILDFITVDDVIIEPITNVNDIENKLYSNIDKNLYSGPNKNLLGSTTFNGPNNYYHNIEFQLYRIKPKENNKFLSGEVIISAKLLSINNSYYNCIVNETGWISINDVLNVKNQRYPNNVVMPLSVITDITGKTDLYDVTDAELVSALPPSFNITIDDIKSIDRDPYLGSISSDVVVTKIIMHFQPIGKDNIYMITDEEYRKLEFFIRDNNSHINLKKYIFNGHTDDLCLSLADEDISMSGCTLGMESATYSTFSLIVDHKECPELCEKLTRYTIWLSSRPSGLYILINTLDADFQSTIINGLSDLHHWKWGLQNKPNNYSDIPSSHNLNGAKVFTIIHLPYYRDNNSWPTYPYMRYNNAILDPDDPMTNNMYAIAIGIILDKKYNTGYDGTLRLYISLPYRILTAKELNI